jgi:DNA-binding protein H-NS
MKYARQTQDALERLDQSLSKLHTLIKRGDNTEALRFMEEGELKERYGELQNMIKISSTSQLGASGIPNTRIIS